MTRVKHLLSYILITLLLVLTSIQLSDSISNQQEDFHVFRTVLESKEGTLDMHLSADSISYYLDLLQVDLSREKSTLEEFKLYSEMVARLDCGHTQVLNNPEKQIVTP